MVRTKKKERHEKLMHHVKEKPFLTDDELSKLLNVSIQTIRLDRAELGIPEVRERIRKVAEEAHDKVTTIEKDDLVGELIELEPGHSGVSLLRVTDDMVFAKNKIAKGHYIFSQANSLALALINAPMAVTGVANIKYKVPVKVGEMLVAKAEVIRQRCNKFFVWVKTRNDREEVFRAKFIVVSLADVK
ncbi:transcription factor FapR [Anaerovibrio sp.]|uniref:transcription factor FapR n=1 Tax=Anaerovibrio sp. TaxID=1872532 RepID=UPI001B4359F2|nr:transcription factor FapR [Anaerovibrio sp.]MBP3231197.1 transcription factor FapR [Anaerovibrio sp.]MBR2143273.1 transcription factor FapR [Anaerovibrio sp.]